MKILVNYFDRSYGTGDDTLSYKLKLSTALKRYIRLPESQGPSKTADSIDICYQFDPPMPGFSQDQNVSNAIVRSASLSLTLNEAEELAKNLLYLVRSSQIEGKSRSVEFKVEPKSTSQAPIK